MSERKYKNGKSTSKLKSGLAGYQSFESSDNAHTEIQPPLSCNGDEALRLAVELNACMLESHAEPMTLMPSYTRRQPSAEGKQSPQLSDDCSDEEEIEETKTANIEDENQDDDEPEEEDVDPLEPVAGIVRMTPSLFRDRASTVFFDYPRDLNITREATWNIEPLKHKTLKYRTYWERNCIKSAFQRAGFARTKGRKWSASWAKHLTGDQFKAMNRFQKVNHFPGSWCIGRKDRLLRTLFKFRRTVGVDAYDFFPEGYILPNERASLFRTLQFDASNDSNNSSNSKLWIMKPVASSCGRGIKVISRNDALEIGKDKKAVVMRYISNPYLIDGRKFDLRIYVLVSSFDPLQIYIFEEGLTRFCTKKYDKNNIKSRYGHLTNFSINKNSQNFQANEDPDNDMSGSKWSLTAFWRYLESTQGEAVLQQVQLKIKDLIIKTMIAAEEEIVPSLLRISKQRGCCFELFGFDVLIDDAFKPWIIEVNISPSLMGSSPLDKKIKGMLVADIFHLVGFFPFDQQQLKKDSEADKESDAMRLTVRRSTSKPKSKQDAWRKSLSPLDIKLEDLSSDELDIISQFEDEKNRCGHFECIFPTREAVVTYWSFFALPRLNNAILSKWLQTGGLGSQRNRRLVKYAKECSSAISPKPEKGVDRGRRIRPQSSIEIDRQSESSSSKKDQRRPSSETQSTESRPQSRGNYSRPSSSASQAPPRPLARGRALHRSSQQAQQAIRTSLGRKHTYLENGLRNRNDSGLDSMSKSVGRLQQPKPSRLEKEQAPVDFLDGLFLPNCTPPIQQQTQHESHPAKFRAMTLSTRNLELDSTGTLSKAEWRNCMI